MHSQPIFSYLQGDFRDNKTFLNLKQKFSAIDKSQFKKTVRLYYFATAPGFIEVISEGLYSNKICNRLALDRIVIE